MFFCDFFDIGEKATECADFFLFCFLTEQMDNWTNNRTNSLQNVSVIRKSLISVEMWKWGETKNERGR